MSELIVKPITIDEIKPHPNADRLEIAVVGGWQIVTGKGNYSVGDMVIHIQPDSMVPRAWAQTWGVEQYLAFKKGQDMGRVRAARLRSVTSFGFLVPNESGAALGADLRSHYGIEKYEPPPPPVGMSAGQMRSEHPLFHRYTDIQNLRNFKDKLCYHEPLVVTEKIHGTNSRIGWVRNVHENTSDGKPILNLVVGTHRTQRDPDDCGIYGLPFEKYRPAFTYVMDWLQETWQEPQPIESVVFYGEIYGAGVQDLHYGAKQEKDYRLFDIAVNGEYLPWSTLEYFQEHFSLPLVPVLTRGVFDFENLVELAQGKTELDDSHIREGVVVRPWMQELKWGRGELDPNPRRMIFKLISDEYLCRKGGSEYH
jgi:RNA ligase (TIGR02306 family)